MIAFEENLIVLLDSIEDCLAKRRLLPASSFPTPVLILFRRWSRVELARLLSLSG